MIKKWLHIISSSIFGFIILAVYLRTQNIWVGHNIFTYLDPFIYLLIPALIGLSGYKYQFITKKEYDRKCMRNIVIANVELILQRIVRPLENNMIQILTFELSFLNNAVSSCLFDKEITKGLIAITDCCNGANLHAQTYFSLKEPSVTYEYLIQNMRENIEGLEQNCNKILELLNKEK